MRIQTLATALALCLPIAAAAQQGEIFIPGADQTFVPQEQAPQARSALARCLANPGAASCTGVNLDPDGIAFESATGAPDVTFETLVLDLDTKTVAVSPAPPQRAPDYSQVQPITGKVALPSVAITIEFDFNSDRIRADQRGKLGSLVAALTDPALSETAYAVIGHTDASGSDSYNCDLSRRRAASVAQALGAAYVQVPLYAVGFGEQVLKNTYDPRAPENRRVTFMRLPDSPGPVLQTAGAICGY